MEFQNEKLTKIIQRHPLTGKEISIDQFVLFPAKQYVSGHQDLDEIFKNIRSDCAKQVELFNSQNKILEAHRIQQRVEYDLEMLQETGYINGIENFWNQVKRVLRKYNGIDRKSFPLFLKECEFRFNFGLPKEQLKTLRKWCDI